MATLPFVDTHVHYWDLKDPALGYDWLQPDWVHPILGDIDGIKVLRYMASEFVAETRFQNVSKAIHVQAAIGIEDPVEETRWLQGQADTTGFPHGIIAHCDLAGERPQDVIEGHLRYANPRGIRDFGRGDYLVDSAWRKGYSLLAGHNLVFCLDPDLEQMDTARSLAEEYPDVVLCIDHAGYPRERGRDYFDFLAEGDGNGGGSAQHDREDLGARDARQRVDGGQLAAVGARVYRAVGCRAYRDGHELARRPALQLLRRRARRLRADPVAAHARRAGGPLLGERGADLPHLTGKHEIAAEALDHLLIDLDPEADARRRIHPAVDVGRAAR